MFNKYILPLITIIALGITCVFVTLYRIPPCLVFDPEVFCTDYSSIAIALMSLSLIFTLTGVFSLINFSIRIYLYHEDIKRNHFNIALRQGLLLSITTVSSLLLIATNLFKWWNLILITLFVLTLEYLLSGKQR